MTDRWKMNRIGFVNFWLYDEEDFEFVDGKLLLRGQNASGKSITTQSFIPVVWILLAPVTEEWNTIFWGKMERKNLQAIFFWNLKKKNPENTVPLVSDSGQSAANPWISGAL